MSLLRTGQSMKRLLVGAQALVLLGLFLPLLAISRPATAAASPAPAARPCTEQRAAAQGDGQPSNQAASPEEQLADAFAPIVYLKRQEKPCDRNGEAYLP